MADEARMHPGVWVALDWGKARIGVAACDRRGVLAYPVETVNAREVPLRRLTALIEELGAERVFVGIPLDLRGKEAVAASYVVTQAQRLQDRLWSPIYLLDERLTTVLASHKLDHTGKDTRGKRAVIDQAAAVEILNLALDRFRAGENSPGELLSKRLRPDPGKGES